MKVDIEPVREFDLEHEPDHIVFLGGGNVQEKSRTRVFQVQGFLCFMTF